MAAIASSRHAAAVPGPESAAQGAADSIVVVVHEDSAELTEESVRAAIGAELHLRALSPGAPDDRSPRGVLTVTYRQAPSELAVTFERPGVASVTRVVTAPGESKAVLDAAALLAANLVNDQTADLLPAPPPPPTEPAVAEPAPPPSPAPPPPVKRFGNASLAYPVATNHDAPDVWTHLSLNLVYGRIGRLDGVEVGLVNTVSGPANGLQLGLVNVVRQQFSGMQLSPLFDQAGAVTGLQLAPVNHSNGSTEGVQLGAVNVAAGDGAGAVIGLVNVGQDFAGAQVGVVNVGRRVRGTQVGLVNVSDDIEGVAVGLVGVSRTGGVHPLVWSSNTTFVNLGVKFATRYSYSILHGAAHHDGDGPLYGAGLIFGTTIPVAHRTFVDLDVGGSHLFANTACCQEKFTGAVARQHDQSLAKVRAMIRGQLAKHLGAFAGVGLTGRVTYPLDHDGDTKVTFAFVPELFGGIQL